MKSSLLKALTLAAFVTLVGCETNHAIAPSQIEKRFYKECSTEPPTVPCGNH